MAREVVTYRIRKESLMAKSRVVALTAVVLLVAALGVSRLMAAEKNGVIMKDGKMRLLQDGKATWPMDYPLTISDGTEVRANGTVRLKDGKQMHVQEGQMVLMDGTIIEGDKARAMQK